MDKQLICLAQAFPSFPPLIYDSINSALSNATIPFLPEIGREIFNSKRRGYINWIFVDSHILQTVRELGDPRISAHWANNTSNNQGHLEIKTPYGIIMVACVESPEAVPREAKYRQKYIDQCFFKEVFPDFELYSENCIPLYIITYVCPPLGQEASNIFVGRISQDQRSWSSICPIQNMIGLATPEQIQTENPPSIKEEIITAKRKPRKRSV